MGLLVKADVSGDVHAPNLSGLVDRALHEAVEEAAASILEKGRADISAAGNFGARWTEGLKANVSGDGDGVNLTVTEDVPYWTVFQFGAVITGKPLLFFKPNQPPAGLPQGAPLPKVISKHSVTIPKKFHLIEIANAEAEKVPLLFQQKLAESVASDVK